MATETTGTTTLPNERLERRLHPDITKIDADIKAVYDGNELEVGWPEGERRMFEGMELAHTYSVAGGEAGDEGKGRIVHDLLERLTADPNIILTFIYRYQGGNNAGHTVVINEKRIATHAIPAGILFDKTCALIGQGCVVHPTDFRTEYEYLNAIAGEGRIDGRVAVSEDAILGTDLHRALEVLTSKKFPEAGGGTGRGIAAAYAQHYDRTGLTMRDLLADNWAERLGDRYDFLAGLCQNAGFDLAAIQIPDFAVTKQRGQAHRMMVGSREEFLARLAQTREWFLRTNLIRDLNPIRDAIIQYPEQNAVVFEGTQGVSIGSWHGSRPDVTASDPSAFGILPGTGGWPIYRIMYRILGIKLPYMSDVGNRTLVTRINLPDRDEDIPQDASIWQRFAAYVRKTAREYGTTTGRPRKINHPDIPMLQHNIEVSGAEILIGTMLDIAQPEFDVRVCVAYRNTETGKLVPFVPGMHHQKNIEPVYRDFPGWDGEACRNAKTFGDLPLNAQRFIAVMQRILQTPIIAVTTGPGQGDIIRLPGYPTV